MTLLVMNSLLALVFSLLVSFDVPTFIIGFGVGFVILRLLPQRPHSGPVRLPNGSDGLRLLRFVRNFTLFMADFLWDLTLSNIQIAYDVWTPGDYYSPRLIEVPVEDLTDFQKALLATRITLTPGTLTADLAEDKSILIVHVMYPKSEGQVEALRRPIDILYRGLNA